MNVIRGGGLPFWIKQAYPFFEKQQGYFDLWRSNKVMGYITLFDNGAMTIHVLQVIKNRSSCQISCLTF